jgi:hypothetical protein
MGGAAHTAVVEPPAPRRSRRTLWIVLGILAAVVLLVAGSAAYAYGQYTAPGDAANSFCSDLKTQNYTRAYEQLSARQRAQFARDQFVQGSALLDRLEGKVTSCQLVNTGGAYGYSLGGSSAALTTVINREIAGALEGTVHLKNENGAWKVDGLDTSLLGVNLMALEAAGAFCAAMQSQAYTVAYALLGAIAQGAVSQAQFEQAAKTHDQIDGQITACTLESLGQDNTDSSASLVASVTRAKLGQRAGKLSLDAENGAWKVATIDQALLGTDLGPLQVGTAVCADMESGNYTAIYTDLASSGIRAYFTQARFVAGYTLKPGIKYAGCQPNLSTYTVSATDASYRIVLYYFFTADGTSVGFQGTMFFVYENGVWKFDGFEFSTQGKSAVIKIGY